MHWGFQSNVSKQEPFEKGSEFGFWTVDAGNWFRLKPLLQDDYK